MQTNMDQLMESFFENQRVAQTSHQTLPLDVAETKSSYVISAAVAGLKSEDIDITVEDGVLTIAGELKNNLETSSSTESDEGAAVKFHLRERQYGGFNRKLRLPKDVDAETISAAQNDGVLTITLGKSEAAQPKKIVIS
ncbi:MAG: HSP20 family protein [Cellvibrionaceae bacterium]|jgi:HSP20 family protein